MGFLLSFGGDINAQNERVGTPLVAAMVQKWNGFCSMTSYNYKCHYAYHRCCTKVLLDWVGYVKGGELGKVRQTAQKVRKKPGIPAPTKGGTR